MPSMQTVLLQVVCILLEGGICRCIASNAVLCLIVYAAEDKSLGMHLQFATRFCESSHTVAECHVITEQMKHPPC